MGAALMVQIRQMKSADISAAASLEKRSQPRPWSEGIFNDELAADNRIYLAAFDPGLVGFGGVMLVGDEAHVTNLLVAEEARGNGIGGRLMLGLVDAAIEAGARHLTLEVRSKNKPATRLYQRFGLAPVGARPGYYGDDDALILWVHDIDSPEYAARLEAIR